MRKRDYEEKKCNKIINEKIKPVGQPSLGGKENMKTNAKKIINKTCWTTQSMRKRSAAANKEATESKLRSSLPE